LRAVLGASERVALKCSENRFFKRHYPHEPPENHRFGVGLQPMGFCPGLAQGGGAAVSGQAG
jgi:hypothetical protein